MHSNKIETSDVSPRQTWHYVYVLYSLKDKGLYIGFSNDLSSRTTQHNKGLSDATKNRRPLKLLYYECFLSKKDAKAREEYLKSGYGRQQLKSILKDTFCKKYLKSHSGFAFRNKQLI